MAISALENILWLDVRMAIACTLRRLTRYQVIHGLVGQYSCLHIQHGQVDVLTFTCAIAVSECGQNRYGGIHAGHDIDNRNTDFLRAAARKIISLPCHAHQTAHGLNHEIVCGIVTLRACLTETGDGAVNDIGFDGLEVFITKAVTA
ncbi:hypothetical protein D3C78_1406030 [compost metagenome]